jgi:hypothetical protein
VLRRALTSFSTPTTLSAPPAEVSERTGVIAICASSQEPFSYVELLQSGATSPL